MEPHSALALTGRSIVITRPAQQTTVLADEIVRRGGRPVLFPAVDILDIEDRSRLEAIIDRLDDYALAIFISPSAVAKAWDAIRARRDFPAHLRVAAVGRGSAAALEHLGLSSVIAPQDGADSESLLRSPELQDVAGKRIVIFRGVGGRELLRDALLARDARVDYAECYRRARPQADLRPLLRSWAAGEIHAVVVTSSEGLHNLCEMLGAAGRRHLARTPLFVPHPRIAATAGELGLTRVIVSGAGDERIVESLAEHFTGR